MDLKKALSLLDAANDEHWTSDGLPRVDTVSDLIRDPGLKRKEITNAAPDLTRDTFDQWKEGSAETNGDAKSTNLDDTGSQDSAGGDVPGEHAAVLDRDIADIMDDEKALEAYSSDLEAEASTLERRRSELDRQIEEIAARQSTVDKLLRVHRNQHGDPVMGDIQNYLESDAKRKAEQAERTRAFLGAGVSFSDVTRELGGAPIDRAMAQRKPAPDSKRPAMPIQRGSVIRD